MIKETVTYKDYNGEEQTDVLYFSLSKMEATLLNAKFGNIEEYYKKLQKENNQYELMIFIRDLMLTAYGERSQDGRQFIKSADVKTKFEWSLAFAELFEALMLDEKRAERFGKGIFETAIANTRDEQRAKLQEVIK